jgi:hypothetical protein
LELWLFAGALFARRLIRLKTASDSLCCPNHFAASLIMRTYRESTANNSV